MNQSSKHGMDLWAESNKKKTWSLIPKSEIRWKKQIFNRDKKDNFAHMLFMFFINFKEKGNVLMKIKTFV